MTRAHSKSEYKRLVAQGRTDVEPPDDAEFKRLIEWARKGLTEMGKRPVPKLVHEGPRSFEVDGDDP